MAGDGPASTEGGHNGADVDDHNGADVDDHNGGETTEDIVPDRPRVAVLTSGGVDSTLAALLLDPFYEVVCCNCTFGVEPLDEAVQPAATALSRPLRTVELDRGVAREAVDRMVADGYPRNGIQQVHEHALETVADRIATDDDRDPAGGDAQKWDQFVAVADGTRRDDRAPTIDRSFAQSLEDRHGIDYLAPLAGYGRSAIDDLAERALQVESGPSEQLSTGDYETELRTIIVEEHGADTVASVFPEHVQSRVVGRQA